MSFCYLVLEIKPLSSTLFQNDHQLFMRVPQTLTPTQGLASGLLTQPFIIVSVAHDSRERATLQRVAISCRRLPLMSPRCPGCGATLLFTQTSQDKVKALGSRCQYQAHSQAPPSWDPEEVSGERRKGISWWLHHIPWGESLAGKTNTEISRNSQKKANSNLLNEHNRRNQIRASRGAGSWAFLGGLKDSGLWVHGSSRWQ